MDKNLLHRFFEGKTTIEEEKRIRQWMEASDMHKDALLNERKLFDATILLLDEERISKRKPSAFRIKELMKIAAAVALTFLISFLYFDKPAGEELVIAMQKIVVPAGQRINIQLSDGTDVWLNSCSSIEYPALFTGKNRTIKLEGEAYFDVAHNANKPFIVQTQQGDVEVLGTSFNIEAYPSDHSFITSLMEGSVKIKRNNRFFMLEPEQLAYLKNGQFYVEPITDYNAYRWREGLICFKEESFTNILRKFEKCYDIKIVNELPGVQSISYSGKFRQTDGILYALRVLQKDIRFTFTRDEDNQTIYIK